MEIKRNIFKRLLDDHEDRRTSVLVGARQVGKTFLLKKIEKTLKRKGFKTKYFDLELPSDIIKFNVPETEIFKLLTESGDIVFIDEFHYLKNASHIFKGIYDSEKNVKIYASGSSSLEIHKHLRESLAGRKIIHHISPCSFEEMNSVGVGVDQYLTFGGLPGLIHLDSHNARKKLLEEILQSYVVKDVKGLIREENIRAFNNLIYLLAQNQASIISGSSLATEVGLTPRTIESHMEILNQTYVNHILYSYSTNLGNELKKSRKSFLFDLGIRNSLLKDFSARSVRKDAGVLVESFVFLELIKKVTPEVDIRFWRTKAGDEVDFVWIKNRIPYPIEVKMGDSGGKIPRGLAAFLRRYPKTKRCFVLHGGKTLNTKIDGIEISFRPWKEAFEIPEMIQ